MGFKENWLKKITINDLALKVQNSMGSVDSGKRLDRESMRRLLEMGEFTYHKERDLDLYLLEEASDRPLILVLDNELKLYRTSIDDVALRKSPTTKEMISIRNAIKILNDKDVVVSRKTDTVENLRSRLIDSLDLSYAAADIEALSRDGRDALENKYGDGVIETLILFAELLDWPPAPRAFQFAHHRIWGRLDKNASGQTALGPLVAFNLMQSRLIMVPEAVNSRDKAAIAALREAADKDGQAEVEGADVWEALKDMVLGLPT